MIRKLAIALSLLGVCFTGLVHALGLGEVTVKSALNQPLNAEIELVNTAGLTINEILPGLATREEFQKANVDRVYFLSDLRFEVITNSKGKAHIVLTSKKPVREPFLNFIVELIWPSGRLLREYALLIDPPLFSDQPTAKVEAPSVAANQSGDVLSVPETATPSTRSILAPIDRINSGSYGPTDANDTLWDIAIKARPSRNVSPQQVMLAIQDLNPNAFIDNNINKLKAGQVLRLPSSEQIKERSQHQAIQLVIAQNEANVGKRTPSVAQGSNAASDSVEPRSVPRSNTAGGDELKLVVSNDTDANSSNSANSGQSNQSGAGADTKLAVTLEKLDKASIENKELNSRVSDLEEQLSTLQRLLTLKNDQLASIQAQMRNNEVQETQGGNSNSVVEDVDPSLSLADAMEKAENQALETTPSEATQKSEMPANIEPSDAVSENAQSEIASDVSEVAKTNESKVLDKEQVTSSPKASTGSSQNLIQTIISNPLYLALTLVGVLALVIILWLVSRHNAKREEEFQSQNGLQASDELFDKDVESSQEDAPDLSGFEQDNDEEQDYENEDTDSLLEQGDDFAEDLDEESQDVLAEAEAYISYGRLDQAVQILEKAISQDPVRADYRLKLLSVYKDLGDRQAFDRQFSELEAIQDNVALSKAEGIRQDFIEEESLAFNSDENLLSSQDIQDIEESESNNASDELDDELSEIENKSFDFDSVSLEEADDDIDLSTELDLESLDSESVLDNADLSVEPDESVEMDDVLSLESDKAGVEAETNSDIAADDFDDSILDVDLDDLDLNAELDQESEIDIDSSHDLQENTASDQSLVSDDVLQETVQAFDEEPDASGLDDSLSDSDEFDFLNGTDEASTKLDLARAYIDMGDIEGAKDILLEVTKEGSEAQQAEARELIDSID